MIMRLNYCLVPILFIYFSCSAQTETIYGNNFTSGQIENVDGLDQLMTGKDSLALILTGVIEQTCQAKGCWMSLVRKDNDPMRVTFVNYSFFVPTNGVTGKVAIINGTCYLKETSVEQLKHYAQDAGSPASSINLIQKSKIEYTFVASGVKIKN